MTRLVGYVGIKPVGDLAETATIVGEALGGIEFIGDTGNLFDEFPAYVAETSELRYALLGVPEPEQDLRDDPTADFALHVASLSSAQDSVVDISEQVLETLGKDGRLTCWLLR